MKKILLIEDDVFLQQLYLDILTQEGYKVTSVTNGKEALKKIQEKGWDLVLLDIILPDMDGFTILETAIKHKKKPTCPVIFMTNLEGAGDIQQLNKADAYWIKSDMSPPDLIERVKKVI